MTRVTAASAPGCFPCSNNVALTAVYVPLLLSLEISIFNDRGNRLRNQKYPLFTREIYGKRFTFSYVPSYYDEPPSLRVLWWDSPYPIAVTRSRIISVDRAKIKRNLARQPNKNNQWNNHYPNRSPSRMGIPPNEYFTLREYGSTLTSNWFYASRGFTTFAYTLHSLSSFSFSVQSSLFPFLLVCLSLEFFRLSPLSFSSFNFFSDFHHSALLYHRIVDLISDGSHTVY